MSSNTQPVPVTKKIFWASLVISALPVLVLAAGGIAKLLKPEFQVKGFEKLGWDPSFSVCIGILELACTVIYLIPRTAVLGAILLAGYLGGAIATHVRAGDPFFFGPLILGMLLWGGLYLRDARLRALLPLRS